MKRKISFQKLIDSGSWNGPYDISTQLQVFDWMLRTGRPHEAYWGKWTRLGIDKCLFGYSANNHDSYTNLLPDIKTRMHLGFISAVVKTPDPAIEKWKKEQNVFLNSFRMLDIDERVPTEKERHNQDRVWCLDREIHNLQKALNRPLKKEFFQPDYPQRVEPYFKSVCFTTIGKGFMVQFRFTFKDDAEYGWPYELYQKEDENVDLFINRVHIHLKTLLLE